VQTSAFRSGNFDLKGILYDERPYDKEMVIISCTKQRGIARIWIKNVQLLGWLNVAFPSNFSGGVYQATVLRLGGSEFDGMWTELTITTYLGK
jgi:hypothetical protein